VREVQCRAREAPVEAEAEEGWNVQWRVVESCGKSGKEAVPGRGRGEIGPEGEDGAEGFD
jgi:hypothetical protein